MTTFVAQLCPRYGSSHVRAKLFRAKTTTTLFGRCGTGVPAKNFCIWHDKRSRCFCPCTPSCPASYSAALQHWRFSDRELTLSEKLARIVILPIFRYAKVIPREFNSHFCLPEGAIPVNHRSLLKSKRPVFKRFTIAFICALSCARTGKGLTPPVLANSVRRKREMAQPKLVDDFCCFAARAHFPCGSESHLAALWTSRISRHIRAL